ncbi:MAG: TonB family protein [Chitinivibrionales bacterium]|nr:TonB family protein [Chitinivibrionales bacterium]MBD3395712.1 TonB family protein [Chitinivibrionales bacterium]
MVDQNRIVVASAGAGILQDKDVLRRIRGSVWGKLDPRFFLIALLSLVFHAAFIFVLNQVKLRPAEMVQIEKIPERFARLIIEKPLPREVTAAKGKEAAAKADEADAESAPEEAKTTEAKREISQTVAKKNVAARVAKVEKKIRTVGVLGILTGTGGTAQGPAVVDVLGAGGSRKERNQDLEAALEQTSGLRKTESIDVLNRKLVKSKDVQVDPREDIDDLLADVRKAKPRDLVKEGDIIIRLPDQIEGAASSSAKRNNSAISEVVNMNKASIKLTYNKHLKRDPTLAGKITVRFTISAAGTVTEVRILENTTGSPVFERDIIRKVRMWRFEAIPEGEVSVTYPFVFQSS